MDMKTMKPYVVPALIAGAAAAAFLIYRFWFAEAPFPEGLIQANGRIEGDQVTVASKFPGRISKLLVRDGDAVGAGQVMLQLDDAQTSAKVEQARQALAALDAKLQGETIAVKTLQQDVPLVVAGAQSALEQSRAQGAKARSAAAQAARDAQRFQELANDGTVEIHRSETSELARQVAVEDSSAASAAVTRAQKQLAQTRLGWEKLQAKQQELAAMTAQRDQARAALTEAESVLGDLTIRAPAEGIIMTRMVDEGEMVAAGAALFNVVNLDRLYLKVYVPEVLIGKLKLGLPAQVYTDAFPDQPFPATARYIASRAEFTPKEVQTPDERVKLVYAVKLYLDGNPHHQLTPGLPADAVIRWQENTPWSPPRW